ncbi:hypothetical protein [Clostridium sp. UBA5119]|uniref:hypothetical protein n=1 Tax=Clostridium sp. UBA5119 TaxID=1946366 RepID=UPI0032169919
MTRISIANGFLCSNVDDICGEMDLTKKEYDFIKGYLGNIEYNSYDKLIELCDMLALPSGF